MTIQEITNSLKAVSLSHVDIKTFDFGEEFLIATGKGKKKPYPMAFLELPFAISFDSDPRFIRLSFAFLVLMPSKFDNVTDDLEAISIAAQIGEAILTKFFDDNRGQISNPSINAVTLREFSDDDVAGVRFEVVLTTLKTYCNKNYESVFK